MKDRSGARKDAILNSLEGARPVEVPPYFYTRLIARMENEVLEKNEKFFLLRPAFLTATLSLLLIVNIVFLYQSNGRKVNEQRNNAPTIESFADAYNLNASTVYE